MFDDTGIVCSPTLSSWIRNAERHEIGESCQAWFALQILRLDFLVRLARCQGFQMTQLNIWSTYNLFGMRPPHK
jgi:hypothetical protein